MVHTPTPPQRCKLWTGGVDQHLDCFVVQSDPFLQLGGILFRKVSHRR
jgi:hypothetical protein